ncbi:hypothetical protein BD413DRAFT_241642 [Trametes elegans]|nr:hypothetical protein BD413DRAFT_241642 [Trametes elegans]
MSEETMRGAEMEQKVVLTPLGCLYFVPSGVRSLHVVRGRTFWDMALVHPRGTTLKSDKIRVAVFASEPRLISKTTWPGQPRVVKTTRTNDHAFRMSCRIPRCVASGDRLRAMQGGHDGQHSDKDTLKPLPCWFCTVGCIKPLGAVPCCGYHHMRLTRA